MSCIYKMDRTTHFEKELLLKIEEYNSELMSEKIIGVFSFDLLPDATARTEGVVVADSDYISVYTDGKLQRKFDLSEVSRLEVENGVGSISVTLAIGDSSEHHVCVATASQAAKTATIVKRINFYIKNGYVPEGRFLPKEQVCSKCGRPFLKGASVCYRCMSKSRNFKRLWEICKGYKKYIIISMVLFFAITGIGLLSPYLNRIMVDDYIQSRNLSDLQGFGVVILGLIGIQLLSRGLSFIRGKCLIFSGNKVIIRLRQMVFEKIERLSISSISEHTVGQLMNRVTGDTAKIQGFITNQLGEILEQVLTLIFVAAVIFVYDYKLALLVLLPAPLVVASFRLFWRFMRKMFHIRWELNSQSSATLHDIFSGIRVVKSYGTERREADRYNHQTALERDAQMKLEKVWAFIMPMLQFFLSFGEFVLLYYVGSKILAKEMTFGEMSQFSAYVGMIYGPLRMLARIPNQIIDVSTSIGKVFDLVDEDEDVKETDKPIDIKITGTVDFENVCFGYEDAKDVLRDINLHIEPGEFIGLVGRSGVGKSTLTNLVMRLYDADEGEVKIDGVNIKQIPQDTLRKSIGAVLQETFLFSGSVYQNIAFAKPEASKDEIIEAAKMAGAHEFIMRLPDGYNTYVGERGHTLSGGERQRISIARALLRNPRILILDEATSALDTETEKIIQDAIDRLSRQRTTIAIAHRLSTLRNATRLIVLDAGRVAETGTHDELMEKKGLYYELVMAQREMTNMPRPHGPMGHRGPRSPR